ncbi:MAG: ABC transporter permease [Rhodothermia bacterium]|nr:ABC transporter permease [Rhodothermia bacterium]
MSLSYSIREGVASLRRAKFASAASTSAMAVALVLIGLFLLLSLEANYVSDWLRQRVGELELFLEDDVSESLAIAMHERARNTPGVAETDYISKAAAQAVFRREFGEGSDLFFDEPFLPASIKLRVSSSYANPDSLNALVDHFESWARVDEVIFNQPLLIKVQKNLSLIRTMGLWLGALVILASVFLVGNTIRLTIYARRLLIRTMKLVGATDTFIRRPFIVEGVLQGLLASILACLALFVLYGFVSSYLPQMDSTGGSGPLFLLIVAVLMMGIFLGWVGSFFAVRRFIKHVALH